MTRNRKVNGSPSTATRRIVFAAGPGTEILDLVGPLQVFARASDMYCRAKPGALPIYSVEVVSLSLRCSLVANCRLHFTADKTYRQVSGKIDTLLVAGGDAIEQDKVSPESIRWLKKSASRARRVGSVCTGAMLLARAGLLDGCAPDFVPAQAPGAPPRFDRQTVWRDADAAGRPQQ